MTHWIGLIGDGVLAVLLVATIAYCARLSKRIRMLQDSRSELAGMIAQFNDATERAFASVAELQEMSKRVTDALQLKIDKANFLADDLAFLIEKSSKLAAQLAQAKAATAAAPPPEKPRPEPQAHSFFQASTQPAKPAPAAPAIKPQPAEIPSSIKSAASLESLLNRLGATPEDLATPPQKQGPRAPRTEAERELFDVLKTNR